MNDSCPSRTPDCIILLLYYYKPGRQFKKKIPFALFTLKELHNYFCAYRYSDVKRFISFAFT